MSVRGRGRGLTMESWLRKAKVNESVSEPFSETSGISDLCH